MGKKKEKQSVKSSTDVKAPAKEVKGFCRNHLISLTNGDVFAIGFPGVWCLTGLSGIWLFVRYKNDSNTGHCTCK